MSKWKETDIGKIPVNWETKEIGDLLEDKGISVGVMYPGEFTADGVPLVRAGDIKNGKIDKTIRYRISKSTNELHKRTILNGDELLVVLVGQPGVGVVVDEYFKGWNVARAVGVLRFIDKSERQFVTYSLKHTGVKSLLLASCNTTVQPTLNLAELKEVLIPWPTKEIRFSIASILSSLDDKIDLLHRQNATLEKMAETLFRQWFVEEAKEEWEDCVLEDLCSQVNSGGTPSTKIESYYNGHINWYATKELNDNFLFESNSKITEDGLKNSSAKLFPKGTVVIAIYAAPTVGRLGILGNESAFNQAACGFITNDKICCKEFIYLFLKSQRDELNAMASGSAQQNLNVGKIKSYPAFIPDATSMAQFKIAIIPMFEKIEKNTMKIRTLTALRDTLLPKLMSGEITINF